MDKEAVMDNLTNRRNPSVSAKNLGSEKARRELRDSNVKVSGSENFYT